MSTPNFRTQKCFDLYVSDMSYELLDDNGEPTGEYDFDEYLFEETKYINNTLLPKLKDYCFDKYGIYAQFSNGETWYVKE